ncbi:hypothetical protein [Asticcacaulis sp. YBE204]|uniref:hypothetical protein n=1 Tax=Asticcacaulis sp. YBE204 TaxID=1282363 RepID=UPI0003C3BF5C|nr:hypothetical protein [Asticcacaulis sp. YBE204]ESQ77853.1 hypothetical protein AEYBE204_17135 [Asticcacaulis sp. YBE204]
MLKTVLATIFLIATNIGVAQAIQPFDMGYRDGEPERLTESSGLAERNADTLILNFDGKPVVHLKDNASGNCPVNECYIWTYWMMWQLKTSADSAPEPHALTVWYPGEGGNLILIGKDGRLFWFDANVAPSPDGRYVTDSAIEEMHSPAQFHLIDWASPDHATAWKAPFPCEIPEWAGPSLFYVACQNPQLKSRSFAEVSLMPDGNWKLRELGGLPKGIWLLDEFIAKGAKVVAVPKRHLREVVLTPFRYDGRPMWPTTEVYNDVMRSVTVVKSK